MPNQKITIQVRYERIATVAIENCNVEIKVVTCSACGASKKVYNHENAVCDYCGSKLNV